MTRAHRPFASGRAPRLAALFALAASVPAQEPSERTLQLAVTAVGDHSVYLDHGRDDGLEIGTLVRLFAPGGEIEVEVRSVSASSARAELPPAVPLPPVGTRGEARVAVERRTTEPAPARTAPPVPEHPPWTRREDPRAPDQPLLVPTYGQRPDERPAEYRGRLFALMQWNRDLGAGRDSDYLLARLGVRADATNAFGAAERIRFAGELADRRVLLADQPDQVDDTARFDLLSVAFGTEHWAPTGVEVGRFLSPHLPEIGLVDGVEVVRRTRGGVRYGAGAGAYPRPFPSHETGQDTGMHAFLDYTADERRSFAFGLGLWKTWHHGDPDRDLLLLRAEGRLAETVRAYGSAKIDFYTGSDTVEDDDLELTEAMATLSWDTADVGASLLGSHFAWPDLERAEYQALPADLVRDGYVDRASVRGWVRPVQGLRLTGRADVWQDQARDGDHLGLDADIRGPLGERTHLGLSVFRNDGGYASGPGLRATLRGPLGAGSWRAGYRWYRYELSDLVSGAEDFTRQSIEIGASLPLGDRSDLDVSFERWFGDREDAFAFGLFLQWRF